MSRSDPYIALGPGGEDDYRKLKVNGANELVTAGTVAGTFTQSGLKNGLKTQTLTITDVATKVPPTALALRNTISVRIMGASDVYFGGSDVTAANGYPKKQFEEISMDITGDTAVSLYAICDTGQSCEIRVMEIA